MCGAGVEILGRRSRLFRVYRVYRVYTIQTEIMSSFGVKYFIPPKKKRHSDELPGGHPIGIEAFLVALSGHSKVL